MNQVTIYSAADGIDAVKKARQMEPETKFFLHRIQTLNLWIVRTADGVVSNDVFTCTKLLINKNGSN